MLELSSYLVVVTRILVTWATRKLLPHYPGHILVPTESEGMLRGMTFLLRESSTCLPSSALSEGGIGVATSRRGMLPTF